MIAAAHQPLFIPWIGYFDKISKADIFVLVDNVQFTTAGWIRRNNIKTEVGAFQIFVPVLNKKHTQIISEVKIDNIKNLKWKRKHLGTISRYYSKSPYFKEIYEKIEAIYEKPIEFLNELNTELIKFICSYLNIKTKIISSTDINAFGIKTGLIIDICIKAGADAFILGMGGSREYADRELIKSKGLQIIEQNFKHPVYDQMYGEFIPNLSVLDFLFNMGPSAKEHFRGKNVMPEFYYHKS